MELFVSFLAVLSGTGCMILLRNLYYSLVSMRWPVHRARVIRSSFEQKVDMDISAARYLPDIRYQYVISGVHYVNDVYNFSRIMMSSSELALVMTKFPVGQEIEIRVHPRKHSQSVIIAGPGILDFVFTLGSVCFFYICISVIIKM